jgi:hypothetical protein
MVNDGKNLFVKKQIIKFYFKFILSENFIFNQDESTLLDSFRSSFGLKKNNGILHVVK